MIRSGWRLIRVGSLDEVIGRNVHEDREEMEACVMPILVTRRGNKQYLSPETSGERNETVTFTFHLAITIAVHSVSTFM